VLVEEKGWSKTALSGVAAMQSVEAALLGPALGWMVDRIGAKAMIRMGILLWVAGLLVLSQVQTIGSFYLAFILIAVGTCLAGFFPVNVTVIQWFSKYRGRALSTVGMGMGLGGICVPLLGWSMESFGWRNTAIGSAVLCALIGLPLTAVFRRRPEECGETVDGLPPASPATAAERQTHALAAAASATTGATSGTPVAATVIASTSSAAASPALAAASQATAVATTAAPTAALSTATAAPEPDFTARQAVRTSAFWFIGLGHAGALLIVTAVNTHAITHMKQDLGYSLAQATMVVTLMTFFQLMGTVTGVLIGDRVDKRLVSAACMVMHGVGMLFLTYATNVAMLVVFTILHGTAWGLRGPFMQALRADYFGRNAIGMIMGLSALITVIGQVLGPMLAGAFADYYGNYEIGFTVLSVLTIFGSLLFLRIRRPAQPPPPTAAA